jgi:protein-tyrosine-phosphatase
MFNVLIVCTANVCRSPLGEAILKKIVEEENLTSLIKVQSCGIWGMDGQKPSELSEQVAMENNLDISQHRARSIRPEMVKPADLILCMTPDHKQELIHFFPSKKNKIFTLKEFSKKIKATESAIADPIGMSLSFYRRIFQEMESEMKRIFPVLKQLAEKKI